MALSTLLNNNRPFNIYMPRTGKLVQDDMNMIIELLWNQGPIAAFNWYQHNVVNGPTEVSVSHRIEALAFEGTNYEVLFNLLCGE